jgi:hypothetical protein
LNSGCLRRCGWRGQGTLYRRRRRWRRCCGSRSTRRSGRAVEPRRNGLRRIGNARGPSGPAVEEQRGCDDDDRRQQQREKEALIHRMRPVRRVSPLGYRIVAAGTEWVTPPDSAECEPATSERTMALERFDGVGGATRIITARCRKQGAECDLVRTHEYNEKRSHQVSLDPGSAGGPRVGDCRGSGVRHFSSCARIRSTSVARAAKPA